MRTYRNLMITMVLGGLWHGASWTFVVWGALHGTGLVVNRLWHLFRQRGAEADARYSIAGNLLTFLFVCFAWIFFRAPDFSTAAVVVGRFAVPALPAIVSWQWALPLLLALAAAHLVTNRLDLKTALASTDDVVFACGYGAAAALVLPFVNIAVRPFIYFQF
jgi:D-alanyl-lipoteichoic acid acyltransferase DltB (MBOAT superfamily)